MSRVPNQNLILQHRLRRLQRLENRINKYRKIVIEICDQAQQVRACIQTLQSQVRTRQDTAQIDRLVRQLRQLDDATTPFVLEIVKLSHEIDRITGR